MLYVAICNKPLARQVIHEVCNNVEITRSHTAKAGRLGATLPNVPILCPVISVFDSLKKFSPGKGIFNND